MLNFEFASGSVIGSYHTKTNKNNHDASFFIEQKDHIIGIVCDGCGSGEHSEVGAKIGAPALAWELSASGLHTIGNDKERAITLLERVRILTSNRIEQCAFRVGLPFVEVIRDFFLFTIVATVIGKDYTYIISFGDGIYSLNGNVVSLGPFPNNAPPYIAYSSVVEHLENITREDLHFTLNEIIPTSEVDNIILGTDGVEDLIAAENKKIPGKDEHVGPLSQFYTNDLFFNNIAAIERRLCLVNRTTNKVNRITKALQVERGHLPDDTTLVVIRRKHDSISEGEQTNSESD